MHKWMMDPENSNMVIMEASSTAQQALTHQKVEKNLPDLYVCSRLVLAVVQQY